MGNTIPEPRLKEFSVVYTAAALNLMSTEFQTCMKQMSAILKEAYSAQHVALVPGSGTFAMESIVQQFVKPTTKVMIIRNGTFSYRWSQIIKSMNLPEPIVVKAKPVYPGELDSTWKPEDIDKVVQQILTDKPAFVFAPHVETATGIMLPHDYITAVGKACRQVDAIFVLDCIASGAMWVDMIDCQVDMLISAPQKAWSGPACCGFVMFQARATVALQASTSSSFSLDLKKWAEVMTKYESGGFLYHTTLPTDALIQVRNQMVATRQFGFKQATQAQIELGKGLREILAGRGFPSVAALGFEAPGVVVVHSPISDMVGRFIVQGYQIAGGMPFFLDEPEKTMTFRVGLFGLEKFTDVKGTLDGFQATLSKALEDGALSKV
ncbi:hypothetical protein BASA81_000228 [Batrachochytrium salamandrivorans]|nr:hypothetical protein BASA81_000228 [Batrachochytrium salamandrivorans]